MRADDFAVHDSLCRQRACRKFRELEVIDRASSLCHDIRHILSCLFSRDLLHEFSVLIQPHAVAVAEHRHCQGRLLCIISRNIDHRPIYRIIARPHGLEPIIAILLIPVDVDSSASQRHRIGASRIVVPAPEEISADTLGRIQTAPVGISVAVQISLTSIHLCVQRVLSVFSQRLAGSFPVSPLSCEERLLRIKIHPVVLVVAPLCILYFVAHVIELAVISIIRCKEELVARVLLAGSRHSIFRPLIGCIRLIERRLPQYD